MATYITRARLTADAVNRTVRTVLQALLVEVGFVVVPELIRALEDKATVWDVDLAVSIGRVAAISALSFVMRRWLDPSRFPTPLPPADPGIPAEPT